MPNWLVVTMGFSGAVSGLVQPFLTAWLVRESRGETSTTSANDTHSAIKKTAYALVLMLRSTPVLASIGMCASLYSLYDLGRRPTLVTGHDVMWACLNTATLLFNGGMVVRQWFRTLDSLNPNHSENLVSRLIDLQGNSTRHLDDLLDRVSFGFQERDKVLERLQR